MGKFIVLGRESGRTMLPVRCNAIRQYCEAFPCAALRQGVLQRHKFLNLRLGFSHRLTGQCCSRLTRGAYSSRSTWPDENYDKDEGNEPRQTYTWPDGYEIDNQPPPPKKTPDPYEFENWMQKIGSWLNRFVQDISENLCQIFPRANRRTVETSVRIGLAVLALAFAKSILSVLMTIGTVFLVLYIGFKFFGKDRNSDDDQYEGPRGGRQGSQRNDRRSQQWEVVEDVVDDGFQFRHAQRDLLDVWRDDSYNDDQENDTRGGMGQGGWAYGS